MFPGPLALPAWSRGPDVVFVLGCQDEHELAARIEAAARVIRFAGSKEASLVILTVS